jgi:hypothetical protein
MHPGMRLSRVRRTVYVVMCTGTANTNSDSCQGKWDGRPGAWNKVLRPYLRLSVYHLGAGPRPRVSTSRIQTRLPGCLSIFLLLLEIIQHPTPGAGVCSITPCRESFAANAPPIRNVLALHDRHLAGKPEEKPPHSLRTQPGPQTIHRSSPGYPATKLNALLILSLDHCCRPLLAHVDADEITTGVSPAARMRSTSCAFNPELLASAASPAHAARHVGGSRCRERPPRAPSTPR